MKRDADETMRRLATVFPLSRRRVAGTWLAGCALHPAVMLALASLPVFAVDDPHEEFPEAPDASTSASLIAAVETTGRTIFEHDRAAAAATDVAMAQRAFKRDRRVRGWLTEARDGGIVVTFIDDTPSALYRVLLSADGEPGSLLALDSPEPLSDFEAGAATARRVALESGFQPCSKTYNTVVLPDETVDGAWVVYLLPGTTRHNTVPIGGTHRVEVRDDAVVAQRAFTRTCITLSRSAKTAAMMITHILDPMPTEAHVHWSLWAETPMYVSTEEGVWAIEEGRLRSLDDNEDE